MVAYRAIDGIAGGLEKMSNALMNELCARGHDVHFYTLDNSNAVSYYEMHESINWHKLNIGEYKNKASLMTRIKRQLKTYKILKDVKPDIILAFQDGAFFNTRIASFLCRVPTVLCERISPQHFDYTSAGRHKNLIWQLYRVATKITIQCASYKDMYPTHLQKRLVTIPNPVFVASRYASPSGNNKHKKMLLCAGRFSYQKNQAILTQAFLELAKDYPDWELCFAGVGEMEEDIRALCYESSQVKFLGNVKDMSSLYGASHLFCLPSLWEGFPNALSEALAHGLPAIGFAECGGVRDLIIDGYNGILAEGARDKETLKMSLSKLMRDARLREVYGENAVESVKRYKEDFIFDQWENFIKDVVNT